MILIGVERVSRSYPHRPDAGEVGVAQVSYARNLEEKAPDSYYIHTDTRETFCMPRHLNRLSLYIGAPRPADAPGNHVTAFVLLREWSRRVLLGGRSRSRKLSSPTIHHPLASNECIDDWQT